MAIVHNFSTPTNTANAQHVRNILDSVFGGNSQDSNAIQDPFSGKTLLQVGETANQSRANEFASPTNLQNFSLAQGSVHFADLANAFGMTPRDFSTAFPTLQTDASGRVAANDVATLKTATASGPEMQNATGGGQIAQRGRLDPGVEGGGGARRDYPADPGTEYEQYIATLPANATVGKDHTLLPGLQVVKDSRGRSTLTGTIAVEIRDPQEEYRNPFSNGSSVSPQLQSRIMGQLSAINQSDGKNSINIKFVPYDPSKHGSQRVVITVGTQSEISAACGSQSAAACVSRNGRKEMSVAYNANNTVVTHEFSHLMGVGHSQNRNSVTYPQEQGGTQKTRFSSQELRNIMEAYRR